MHKLWRLPMMMLRRWTRKLWVRVTLYAALAVVMAFATTLAEPFLPPGLTTLFGPDAVTPILTILASSMLAVSTFSLNVMVSAHRSAADNATPRIHRILLEDRTTHTVLATFIGAFVYALITLILLQTNVYSDKAAVIVMAVTVVMVVLVIIALLRWIEHLTRLGSMDDSIQTAYARARDSLMEHRKSPALGGVPMTPETVLPDALTSVRAKRSGYVQLVDIGGLQACATGQSRVYVTAPAGQHVLRSQVIAQVSGNVPDAAMETMARCFLIEDIRSFEQDPVFGLTVLSEIAAKALSPGVNDPGTAIEVTSRLQALIWDQSLIDTEAKAPSCDRVFVPVPQADTLIEAGFAPLASYGAGAPEVALHLRRALLQLARSPDTEIARAAQDMADRALTYAEAALALEADKTMLRDLRG